MTTAAERLAIMKRLLDLNNRSGAMARSIAKLKLRDLGCVPFRAATVRERLRSSQFSLPHGRGSKNFRSQCETDMGPDAMARSRPRNGATIIIAMVVLLILMAISSTLISSVVHTRTQFVREEQRLQTDLIAEAGLGRGIARLRTDRSFKGETWQIPIEQLTGIGPAHVVITVTKTADAPGQRIVAAAEYPVGTPNPIRITRELRIPSPEPPP